MANRHKSSIKRARQTVKRRQKNRVKRDQIKEAIKSVQNAKDTAEYQASFKKATKVISRLATKGILHKNTAARRQSRLAKLASKVGKSAPAQPAA